MPELWMRKTLSSVLEPADDVAREYLKKIRPGQDVRVKVTRPRNSKFHRKYFSLLNVVFDNQEKYSSFDAFRAEVTMRAGFFTEHRHLSGRVSFQPKSISFASMDELEFGDLYSRTIDVLLEHFIPGTDRADLEEAVLGYSG